MIDLFFRSGGWYVTVFFGVFLFLTIISAYFFYAAARLDEGGAIKIAKVSEKFIKEHETEDGTSYTYWLRLQYINGSRTITTDTNVSKSRFSQTFVGDTFELRHMKDRPHRIEYPVGANKTQAYVYQAFALIFGILWLVFFWTVGKWVVQAHRARKLGKHLRATVTGYQLTSGRETDADKSKYVLVWRDEQGRRGQSLPDRKANFDGYDVGDELIVFESDGRTFWRGDVGDRIPRLSPIPISKRP